MPWFRIDDNFHQHPKVTAAGNAATGLWVRCGSYSSSYLTDGHVPAKLATSLGSRREVAALVDTKLWVEVDDGFWMPDYLEYNPSAEQVRAERAKARERQAELRSRRNGHHA